MRSVISLILVYCLAITNVFAQSVNPNDQLKIGKASSSTDKGIIFDTNDGVSNKKLTIEKVSKKLKFDGNNVQIGDGSTGNDKNLVLDSTTGAGIKWTGGALNFSNNGSLYKKLGSGSGSGGSSGISILANDSFEDGLTPGWTNVGGTFSQQTYANSVDSDTKYARFIASGSGQYFESTAVAVPSSFSGGCQADFKKYNTATSSAFKIEAMDTAGTTIYATQTLVSGSWIKAPTINFVCPASGTLIKIRVTSLLAGTIEVDRGYLGSNQNIVNTIVSNDTDPTSYTPVFGAGFGTPTAVNMKWQRKGGSVRIFGDFTTGTVTAATPTISLPIVNGVQIASDSSIGSNFKELGSVLVGTLTLNFTKRPTALIAASAQAIGFSVGEYAINSINPTNQQNNATLMFETGKQVSIDVTIPIQGWSEIRQQDVAISPEQSAWFIDANIGGSNLNLGTGSVSSYTEIQSTGIDLVLNSSKGSASAEIACASGTGSSGLNCGGATESLGVAFLPPSAGMYEACFDFTHYVDLSVNGLVFSTFQVVETSNTSSAILVEGGARVMSGSSYGASANGGLNSYHQKVCGTFNFADISKKTLRLMYEQTTIATVGQNDVRADRSSTYGQRDIKVTVRPLLSAYNRPILTGDQVTTPGILNPKTYSGRVNNTGVITHNYGGLLNSCSWSPVGFLTCSFVAGKFTTDPNCVISSSASEHGLANSPTVSSIGIFTASSSGVAATATTVEIFCHGY